MAGTSVRSAFLVSSLGDAPRKFHAIAYSSFRDAPLGAGAESILIVVVMDSGLALRAPRNDGFGCFAEPASGRRFSLTRWLAMTTIPPALRRRSCCGSP